MASGAYLLSPPQTIFTLYPIYTDAVAAIADWFKENWKENRKPKVAYLTADNAMGKSIEINEMKAYLEKSGYEFAGAQYVPLIPSAPPTTQLSWLKKNQVDLALGVMINAGSQPTIKEAARLDMGPHLSYKITFGFASPSHLGIFCPDMGTVGDGTVVAGSYPSMDDLNVRGIRFCNDLQAKYRPGKPVPHIMYPHGIIEVMTQVEALRLALEAVPYEKLKSVNVLEQGFYRIKNLDTGDLSSTLLNYGPGQIEGVDKVRVDQAQGGKPVKLGVWPCKGLYPR
jgi:branched-chain amino acid transport system substrate-binding protein